MVIRDHHPFSTIRKKNKAQLEIEYPYFDSGPIIEDDRFGAKHYMYHWTVSDQFKAIIAAGCNIIDVDEWGEKPLIILRIFLGKGCQALYLFTRERGSF